MGTDLVAALLACPLVLRTTLVWGGLGAGIGALRRWPFTRRSHRSALVGGVDGSRPSSDGHQFARPIIVVKAGTVTVRTRKVSSTIPMPMVKPA